MKNFIILFIISVAISSCSKDEVIKPTPNEVVNNEYVFALVSSKDECDNLIYQGVNCTKTVNFLSNTDVTVMVTDIMNPGTYVVNENIITITFSDMGGTMIFKANDDFTELIRISSGNETWKLQKPGIDPWDL